MWRNASGLESGVGGAVCVRPRDPSSPGSATRKDIGWLVVGGLIFGTVLFVVPTVHSLLSRQRRPLQAIPSDTEIKGAATP